MTRRIALLLGNGQKQMLGRNVFILEIVSFLESPLEHLVQRLAHVLLGKALDLRQLGDLFFNFLRQDFAANSQARQKRWHHAIGLRGQRREQVHRLNLLVFLRRSNFLRSLYGFLRLDGHFFKSQHNNPLSSAFYRKRADAMASPFLLPQFPANYFPAAAAIAGVPALTLICLGLASSRFGMVSVSTPFWYSALMASAFTVFARVKLRENVP